MNKQQIIDKYLAKMENNNFGFPTAKNVLLKRLKKSGINQPNVLAAINKNSIALISIQNEIDATKTLLSTILSQASLLINPPLFTAVIPTINSILPQTIKSLVNLEVAIPNQLFALINQLNNFSLYLNNSVISNSLIKESPVGDINGTNRTFILSHSIVSGNELVFLNGLLQIDSDYIISGSNLVFTLAPYSGDIVTVIYSKT